MHALRAPKERFIKVTQKAIARQVGVSISTVSRALSHARGPDEEIRRRVWEAARELGYKDWSGPRTLHRPLPKTLKQVGLFTPLPNQLDPFHASVLQGIEAACREFELNLSVSFIHSQVDSFAFIAAKLAAERYDALLFMSIDEPTLARQLKEHGLEAVFVNTDLPELGFDSYLVDNWHASRTALEHLFEHGHRDILHLTNLDRSTIRRRFYAYQTFMIEKTGRYRPELVITCALNSSAAYEAIKQRLEQQGLDYSAIFCANDSSAIGAIKALQDAGFNVPGDVSVIGFDNIDIAAFASPPLTTLESDGVYLGKLALQGVAERYTAPKNQPVRVEISPVLIKRQSVAPRR